MTRRFPWTETVLASLASSTLVGLWLLPPTPYLVPDLHPLALGLSSLWTLWRLWVLERRYSRWLAWHFSPRWVSTPQALAMPSGVRLGKGFRWEAPHVERLERALLLDGGLPEGRDARAGYPALHAVGQTAERAVEMSWTELTTHLGLFGTTGSGKSRALEVVLAQVIGAD